jgi:predicted phosphodiesterase
VYGNHDLPQHNKELAYKTATWALKCADALCVLNGVHWGDKPGIEYAFEYKGRNILVYHVMTWKGKEPWPGCTDLSAKRLLKKYSEFDLIVTGHNHKSFTEEYQGRILVNPGSLTRQTADQHKTTPCVYLYNAKNHKIKRHILKHNKQAISRVHLQQVAKTQQRYTAFLQSVKNKEGDLLRFEDMLESFFQTHNVKEPIRRHIYKHMGEESWM